MLRVRFPFCVFLVLTFLFAHPFKALAEYELLDAIKEFGEKRFIDVKPTKLALGPVRIHPTIRSNVEFDTNVYLQEKKGTEDIVWHTSPGVVLELPINRHQIAVGYEADFENFTKTRNHSQNDQNQQFFTLVDLNFPRFYINFLEEFRETSSRAGTTFSERIPRYDNSVHPKVGIRMGRTIFEAAFRHFIRDYRRSIDDSRDFQNVDWTGIVYYELFARLKALAEYKYGQIDYDDNFLRKATINEALLGLDGELMPNLTLQVKVGPHFRNYIESQETDFNSWIGTASFDYEMRENLRFNLTLKRNALEATFGDVNYLKRHLIGLGFEWDVLPRWTLYGRTKYYKDNYSERTTRAGRTGYRRDDHFGWETGLIYRLREWMEFEAGYQFARRDSNFSTFDYTDHRLSLASHLTY
jgi:hypothetical protein